MIEDDTEHAETDAVAVDAGTDIDGKEAFDEAPDISGQYSSSLPPRVTCCGSVGRWSDCFEEMYCDEEGVVIEGRRFHQRK